MFACEETPDQFVSSKKYESNLAIIIMSSHQKGLPAWVFCLFQ
jgi:hypothetical protein